MAKCRLIKYERRRPLWCERCGKKKVDDHEYSVRVGIQTQGMEVLALVCETCANALRFITLEPWALAERLPRGLPKRFGVQKVDVLPALESDQRDVGA